MSVTYLSNKFKGSCRNLR